MRHIKGPGYYRTTRLMELPSEISDDMCQVIHDSIEYACRDGLPDGLFTIGLEGYQVGPVNQARITLALHEAGWCVREIIARRPTSFSHSTAADTTRGHGWIISAHEPAIDDRWPDEPIA